MTTPRLRLMDLLAALSVTTDLGMGQPPETALRSSLLATALARTMALPDNNVRNTCLGTLLRHVGCTATASAEARLYGGDELVSRQAAQPADFGKPHDMLRLTLATGRGADSCAPRESPSRSSATCSVAGDQASLAITDDDAGVSNNVRVRLLQRDAAHQQAR